MLSFKLGQLAIAAGCTTAEIKKFLKEGVLPAPHSKGSKLESYGQEHLDQLELLLACRAADLTFAQIRELKMSGKESLLKSADAVKLAHRIERKIGRFAVLRTTLLDLAQSRESDR